jgi:uncharacterized protein YraI
MYHAGQFVKITGTPGANLRSDPSTQSDANIIQGIPTGTVVPVVGDSQNGFAQVAYLGASGFVSENFVAAASAADVQAPRTITPGPYRITGSNVNIRSGPSLNDGILVETGPVGETFVATGPAQNGYAAGTYTKGGENFRGWIAEQYLGFGQDPATRPNLPTATVTKPTVPVTNVSQTSKPSGVMMAGGLLALAVVIYFMAK